MVKIDVKKILITDPIVAAAKTVNSSFSPKGFKKQPGEQGFPLPRIATNLKETGTPPAIIVKPYGSTGYYEIQDGRHRFAIAIAKGETEIEADIQSGGKKRRKTRRRKPTPSSRRQIRPSWR